MRSVKKIVKGIYLNFRGKNWHKKSYSQCGEDIIVEMIFNCLKIKHPVYLDIGAHHPIVLNNTYFFYKQGGRGVLVEPDPSLFRKSKRLRPGDTCLNAGIGFDNKENNSDFYVMTTTTLSTFSKEEAERYQAYEKDKIRKIIKIPLMNINELILRNFDKPVNYISIDTEGLDFEIIKSFDFKISRPEVFCIETLTYAEDKTEKKISEIISHMLENGYSLFSDTHVNSIFVDKKVWENRC